MLIRRIFAVLLILVAAVASLLAVGYRSAIDHTVENSRRLDSQFKLVAGAITDFRRSQGRQPNSKEFETIIPPTSNGSYQIQMVEPGFDQCDHNAAEYSRMGKDEYVLAAWRGEWWECYAPTRKMSTLYLERSEYTISGNFFSDMLAFIVFAALCLAVAVKLWIWKPNGLSTPP